MKVFLVNLDRRPDRLDQFTKQAEKIGLEFERHAAVDGQSDSLKSRAEGKHSQITGFPLDYYACACFESHRKIWENLVKTTSDGVVVLEDDIVLMPDFAEVISGKLIPEDAHIIRLETKLTRAHVGKVPAIEIGTRCIRKLHSRIAGTGAYLITRKGAEYLLAQTEEFSDPIDEFLYNQKSPISTELNKYQMIPAPAIPADRLPDFMAADWAASTIALGRHAHVADGSKLQNEKALARRVIKRIREELRARLIGSSYQFVPFG